MEAIKSESEHEPLCERSVRTASVIFFREIGVEDLSRNESNRRTSHQSQHTRRSDFGSGRSLSTRVFDGWLRNRFAKAAALVFSQRHDRTSSQSTFGESLSKASVTQ